MEALRYRRPATALGLLMGCLLLGSISACGGGRTPEAVPSNRPSAAVSVERGTRPTPTEEKTTTAGAAEPTRTKEPRTQTPGPTRTEETTAQTPGPTRTEATKTQEPTGAEKNTTASSTSAAAVPVSEEDGGGLGAAGWLVLIVIGLLTALVVLLLTGRNRKVAAWDGEARGLADQTRTVLGVRLPPVLSTTDPAQRGLAWPPARDDLTSLEARWAALVQTAPDGERQAYATQLSGMLGDLIDAVDAEDEAIVSGGDWRMLRPRLDTIIAALTAAVAYPSGTAQPGYAAPAYGESIAERPVGDYPPQPRNNLPEGGGQPRPGPR